MPELHFRLHRSRLRPVHRFQPAGLLRKLLRHRCSCCWNRYPLSIQLRPCPKSKPEELQSLLLFLISYKSSFLFFNPNSPQMGRDSLSKIVLQKLQRPLLYCILFRSSSIFSLFLWNVFIILHFFWFVKSF